MAVFHVAVILLCQLLALTYCELVLRQSLPNYPFRVHCPPNYAITQISLQKVTLPNELAIQNETIFTIFCESIADLFPRQADDANHDVEECALVKEFQLDSRTKQSAESTCAENDYLAGFSRVSVPQNLIKQLCCRMRGREATQCKHRTAFLPTLREPSVSLAASQQGGFIMTSFELHANDVIDGTFCKYESGKNQGKPDEPASRRRPQPPGLRPGPTDLSVVNKNTSNNGNSSQEVSADSREHSLENSAERNNTNSSSSTTLSSESTTEITTIEITTTEITTTEIPTTLPTTTPTRAERTQPTPPRNRPTLPRRSSTTTKPTASSPRGDSIIKPIPSIDIGRPAENLCTLDTSLKDKSLGYIIACGDSSSVWSPERCPKGYVCSTAPQAGFRVCCELK